MAVAAGQHWVVARRQLLWLGLGAGAIRHRVRSGRLHPLWPGVYAVGRADVSDRGRWRAATLTCGLGARLSHRSAAELWGICEPGAGPVHVTLCCTRALRRSGIVVHRREKALQEEVRRIAGIPVSDPVLTMIDLAAVLRAAPLARAVREADRLDLVDPVVLRRAVDGDGRRRHGIKALRDLLDADALLLTDSELERRFLPLARAAGMPKPRTQALVAGFRVDFHFAELGLVVETDGLRYHRTASQQAQDLRRDQAHAAAGLATLRFTHAQVTREPEYVIATLRRVAARRRSRPDR